LNTCIRNTEEAEWNAQLSSTNGASGRGQGKGVWGMIEDSRLAKTLRKDGVKAETHSPREPLERPLISGCAQNESEAVVQAQQCRDQLQELIARSTPTSGSDAAETQEALELIERAKALLPGLVEVIRTCSDSGRLDEILNLNDTLVSLVAQATPKPKASLQGLGLELNGLGNPEVNNGSGMVNHIVSPRGDSTEELSDDDSLSTPRLDKGKGKAPPEPEIVKPVLSPRGFAAADSDSDENGHEAEQEEDDPRSPTDLSKSWVAEEGEIFRKGTKLLGPEEMEGEFAGEELRIELLEAQVERPPPRAILDDLSLALDSSVVDVNSPVMEEQPKPIPPQPYISRRSSPSLSSPTQPPSGGGRDGSTESPLASSPSPLSPLPRPHLTRKKESGSSFESR